MVRFIDGPADGVRLSLQRIALFLRVVRDTDGTWDALDQLADSPQPSEAIFVYRFLSREGGAFIYGRDPGTGKRWGRYEEMATYRVHTVQPDDATLRDNAAWAKWCHEQPEAERFKKS